MSDNTLPELTEKQPRQCPFLKQQCIKQRCTLWASMAVIKPNNLGVPLRITYEGCAFCLSLVVAQIRQPVAVPMGRKL